MLIEIFEPILVASVQEARQLELRPQELQLCQAVAQLYKETGRAVTIRELSKHLNWKEKRVYKEVQRAVEDRVVRYEPLTRKKNVKRILPCGESTNRFLPPPKNVLKNNPEIGKKVKYVHPFTGKWRAVSR
jgi:DNA-directed RNA polymerase specialized sigma subunit